MGVGSLIAAYKSKVNNQLRVNKQLNISKIIHFHSKHICSEEFQCQRPLSGLFEKSKQTAESKQTANFDKIHEFSSTTEIT